MGLRGNSVQFGKGALFDAERYYLVSIFTAPFYNKRLSAKIIHTADSLHNIYQFYIDNFLYDILQFDILLDIKLYSQERWKMLSYKKLYLKLFNSVTDGINALENFDGVKALQILKQAQIDCEELYISSQESKQPKRNH